MVYFRATPNSSKITQCCIKLPSLPLTLDIFDSFVFVQRHLWVQGRASLRAANWVRVGERAGRGRNDRTHAGPETRKAVYVYELEPAWRERLALPPPAPNSCGTAIPNSLP